MPSNRHDVRIAPMMRYTHRHWRLMLRLINPKLILYTEMICAQTLANHDNLEPFLGYDLREKPLALQLGGCDPKMLALQCKIAQDLGYNEVNLNAGCPSDRVRAGGFGAQLMQTPYRLASCLSAMRQACNIDVTVKTRIGVDHDDSDAFAKNLIEHIASAGITTIILHARKAWLKGLSPKDNRRVPPLNFDRVERLQDHFKNLDLIINGGLDSKDAVDAAHRRFKGVMIGRAALQAPMWLATLNDQASPSLGNIISTYIEYLDQFDVIRQPMIAPLMGLMSGWPQARKQRRMLSTALIDQNLLKSRLQWLRKHAHEQPMMDMVS